jgi:hypothetical protein
VGPGRTPCPAPRGSRTPDRAEVLKKSNFFLTSGLQPRRYVDEDSSPWGLRAIGAEELMADFNISTLAPGERESAHADAHPRWDSRVEE